MSETVLKIENLTKIFMVRGKKAFAAVDHVSFQLKKGETLGIIGESGCGKSTLAKLLCRLQEPTEGKVELCGQDITKARGAGSLRSAYRHIQMVFQDPVSSFDPRKTLGGRDRREASGIREKAGEKQNCGYGNC